MSTEFEQTDMLDLDVHTSDPWDLYAWMRDEQPLFWDQTNEIWAVSRYSDVVYVSRRTDLFCSGQGVVPTMDLDMWPDEAMINLDGAAHACQRGLVSRGFTPRRIAALEPNIREATSALIDRMAPLGEADLVRDLARPLPFQIISQMLGYPEDNIERVLDWTDVYTRGGCGPNYITEQIVEAFANFCMFHEELLEQKKQNPGEDLLSIWLSAELDGQKLEEHKLLYEHNLLLVGGAETTRSVISMGLAALMEKPDQMAWLQENIDDPEAMGQAVEEMIRWSTPFVRMARTATRDIEMHGKTILEGQQIIMLYPSANHDPRAFDEPDVFDIRREREKGHLAFGIGTHFCLGASLARMETKIVVETLLKRLPDVRLKEGTTPQRVQSCFVRSTSSCPVVFSAVGGV
jgi:cytochrome P450 family 142 subfamily A polypeptide 1